MRGVHIFLDLPIRLLPNVSSKFTGAVNFLKEMKCIVGILILM